VEALPCQVRPGACCSGAPTIAAAWALGPVPQLQPARWWRPCPAKYVQVRAAATCVRLGSVPPAVPWPCRRLPGPCCCPYRQPYHGPAAGCQVRAAVRTASRTMAVPQAARSVPPSVSPAVPWPCRRLPGRRSMPLAWSLRGPPCPCRCAYSRPQHAPSVVTAWAARSVPLSLHGCGQYRRPQHAPSVVTAWAARSVPLSLHGCGQYRRPQHAPSMVTAWAAIATAAMMPNSETVARKRR
jgi:hypothetical protein